LPAGVIFAAVGWSVGSAVRVHPHYLSYFNELVGGPDNGWRYLAGSNVDWGQDLYLLKAWLDDHPEARPLHLAYYGPTDPSLFGIDYRLPVAGPVDESERHEPEPAFRGPEPGWYAISVNFLCGQRFYVFGENHRRSIAPLGAYSYFQKLKPADKVGYSVYLYHVTPTDVDELRRAYGPPPSSHAITRGSRS
jgi:hypothetical protein